MVLPYNQKWLSKASTFISYIFLYIKFFLGLNPYKSVKRRDLRSRWYGEYRKIMLTKVPKESVQKCSCLNSRTPSEVEASLNNLSSWLKIWDGVVWKYRQSLRVNSDINERVVHGAGFSSKASTVSTNSDLCQCESFTVYQYTCML